jgi:hypothetical protein
MLRTLFTGLLLASTALAQTRPSRQGLDSLSDEVLMNELASRGMETLLDRAFELNNVPQAERAARRTLVSMAKLGDASAKLSSTERQHIINEVVRGLQLALPTINDPHLLMRQVSVLITAGVERDINALEYWGENPRKQAEVRPIIETIIKMLDRCANLARAQSEDLANKINSPSSPLVAKYEEMDRLAATAQYTRYMVHYYLALSLDKSSPRRKQVAQEAFDYLEQFDVEENPDRNLVRTRMAKLMMVRGDYDRAREIFDQVTEGPTAEAKSVAIQYEARYFAAVTELLARRIETAKQHLADLLAWQQRNLPQQDKAAQAGAEAAAAMLRYRIHTLEAELAQDPAARKQANDAAVAVLMELLSKRPDLRGIIYEQLLPRMEHQADLSTMDPLLLRALVARGEDQLRTEGQVDQQAIERALDAAREIIARRGKPGVDQLMVDSATLLVAFFQDKLGQKLEAAAAFLDYAEKNTTSRNARLALDNAQALIGELRRTQRDDPQVVALYERFLPLAIAPPYARTQFAFEYARRLQLNGQHREAANFYRMVPDADARSLDARYFELVALTQRLEDDPSAANERAAVLADVQRLADEVSTRASQELSQRSADEPSQQRYRSMLARTALLAADLARREQKDPARAMQLLSSFESSIQGLPRADALLADAMFIRVQALMAQEKYSQATQELVKLLQRTEGAHGAQIVYNLLEKLNRDFDRAQAAGDVDQMRGLAKNRAQLSGFLVDWAANNDDPNIRRFTYRYKVFDADTHRRAADLDPDPESRRTGLAKAREKYVALESPENVELYRQSIDPAVVDPDAPDPQVEYGLALIEYDLSNWQAAHERFSRLLTSRRIGSPVNAVSEDGDTKYVDNDAYWEVVLKLIRCNQKLGSGIEESKSFLKQQYITWGARVGGRKWKAEFDALRKELIPDFDPTLPPTTQP